MERIEDSEIEMSHCRDEGNREEEDPESEMNDCQDEGITEEDEEDIANIQMSRSNMAILHFLFTAPKWSISLFLFLAARCVPMSTPYESIEQPLRRLQTIVERESLSYQQCAIRAFDLLQVDLQHTTDEEYDRVSQCHQFNEALIQDAQRDTNACAKVTQKSRDSLVQWRDNGMEITWETDTSICSETDSGFLGSFLGEEFRLAEDEVSFVLDGYIQRSHQSLELFRSYAVDRFTYDYEFFVKDRIEPAVALLENISGFESFRSFIDQREIESLIRESLREVEAALEHAMTQIDALTFRLTELSASILEMYNGYVALYTRLAEVTDKFRNSLPSFIPVPSFLDISGFPLGGSFLPGPFMDAHLFEEELKSAQALLDSATKNCLGVLNNVAQDLVSQANHHLRGASSELSNALAALLEFSDYHPPSFLGSHEGISSLSEEMDLLGQLGQSAREGTQTAISRLHTTVDVDFPDLVDIPTLDSGNYSLSGDTTTFDYLQPKFPFFSIPELLELLATLLYSHTWIIEVLVQALRLWRLEATYARGAIPEMPEIDYGDGDEDEDSEKPGTTYLLVKTILPSFASPRMCCLVLFSPICIAFLILWFPHVKMNCEESNNGTYIARNFFTPLLVNQANALGNAYYLKGESQCHYSQRRICDRMRTDADQLYGSDIASLHAIQLQYNRSVEALDVVRTCVDQQTSEQMHSACCGLKGFAHDCEDTPADLVCPIDRSVVPAVPFRPLDESLSDRACDGKVSKLSLADARFDCLPLAQTCSNIPCAGVNEVLIKSQIIKTDCEVELYAMSFFRFLLVFFFNALAVNLVCTLLFNGMRQLVWRRLCPTGIRLRTRLREDGNLAKGAEKLDRAERISHAIRRFERLGRLQIVLGALVLLTWVVSVSVLKF